MRVEGREEGVVDWEEGGVEGTWEAGSVEAVGRGEEGFAAHLGIFGGG